MKTLFILFVLTSTAFSMYLDPNQRHTDSTTGQVFYPDFSRPNNTAGILPPNFGQISPAPTNPVIGCFPAPNQQPELHAHNPWYRPQPQYYPQISYPSYTPHTVYQPRSYDYYMPQDYRVTGPSYMDQSPRGYNAKAYYENNSPSYPYYPQNRAQFQ